MSSSWSLSYFSPFCGSIDRSIDWPVLGSQGLRAGSESRWCWVWTRASWWRMNRAAWQNLPAQPLHQTPSWSPGLHLDGVEGNTQCFHFNARLHLNCGHFSYFKQLAMTHHLQAHLFHAVLLCSSQALSFHLNGCLITVMMSPTPTILPPPGLCVCVRVRACGKAQWL